MLQVAGVCISWRGQGEEVLIREMRPNGFWVQQGTGKRMWAYLVQPTTSHHQPLPASDLPDLVIFIHWAGIIHNKNKANPWGHHVDEIN